MSIVMLSVGNPKDSEIARTLVQGSGGFAPLLRLYHSFDTSRLDLSAIEHDIEHCALVMLVPCVESGIKNSQVQCFERETLKRTLRHNKACGILTRKLSFAVAPHLAEFGDRFKVIISYEEIDESGAISSVFPYAKRLTLLSVWSVPSVLQKTLDIVARIPV